jgi:hypothetical protein
MESEESTVSIARNSIALSADTALRVGDPANSDVIGIAAQIRALKGQSSSAFSLLVMPTSAHHSAIDLVQEMAVALRQIGEKSILVIEFSSRDACEKADGLTTPYSSDNEALVCEDTLFEVTQMPRFVKATLRNPDSDPTASASSEAFRSFLGAAKTRFSYLLIVAPSLERKIEALLIAPHCDGVLLTVGKGESRISETKKTITTLTRVNARLIGFVFDRTPSTQDL